MPRKNKNPNRLLGDLSTEELLNRIIRVDHAGEFGAKQIYAGQLAVLGESEESDELREMAAAEEHHLKTFDNLVVERKVRPTVLMPIWKFAGFALGAGTALLGRETAMACTVAVEEVIEEHYADQCAQLDSLPKNEAEPALKKVIEEFRLEEIQHRDTAIANHAEQAPGYPALSSVIKTGSRIAIWLSERI